MSFADPKRSQQAVELVVAALSAHYGRPFTFEHAFEHNTCPGCFGFLGVADGMPLPTHSERMEEVVRKTHALKDFFPGMRLRIQYIYVNGHLDIKLPKGDC